MDKGSYKISKLVKKILLIIAYTSLGSLLGAIIIYVNLMQNRPDLFAWHTVELKQEFTAEKLSEIVSFSDYLSLEDRLFEELQVKIYKKKSDKQQYQLIRYNSGSLADPTVFEKNWNRSFELKQDKPEAAVLLLHGLSDSPYSLRSLAHTLHEQGYYVLALRMPGHGTIPSGLVDANWQDMAAAVKLAVRHIDRIMEPGSELHLIGYSMGAAQAVNYSLDAVQDKSLPRAKSLVLISPAIGVSSVAALAVWQSRLSAIPGLEKLAWNSIGPEYDPFKYTSFAINAGDLMYQLTLSIGKKLNEMEVQKRTAEFPKVQVFLSIVDATVSVSAVKKHLLDRLENEDNELVLFDINRNDNVIPFLKSDPIESITALMNATELGFSVSLLSNESTDSLQLLETSKSTGNTIHERKLDLAWPEGVYSLSHIALPFPADDSLYGSRPAGKGLHIGLVSPRGERGILSVQASDIMRLRYNPFYPYLERRILDFVHNE
jgi:alpha-beta hydrolase superfamily lysophospholipase